MSHLPRRWGDDDPDEWHVYRSAFHRPAPCALCGRRPRQPERLDCAECERRAQESEDAASVTGRPLDCASDGAQSSTRTKGA